MSNEQPLTTETTVEEEWVTEDVSLSYQTVVVLSELYNRVIGAKQSAESTKAVFDMLNDGFLRELKSVATFNGLPETTRFNLDFQGQKMVVQYPKGTRKDIRINLNSPSSLILSNVIDEKHKELIAK